MIPKRDGSTANTRSQSGARRPTSPATRSSSKSGRVRTGAVRWLHALVSPDPQHFLFSPTSSYRTSRLPSATNNNKTAKSPPFLLQYSRKSLFSRTSNTLPPLAPGQTRSRRGRVRTVPSSRANSSKLSRLELEPVLGKRSRSASEEPNYNHNQVSHHPSPNHGLEIRGSETLLQSPSKEEGQHHHHHHPSRPRRLTKVETVRVLRARSALLLPLPSPSIPTHPSMQVQPLVLKSEERKKKRR